MLPIILRFLALLTLAPLGACSGSDLDNTRDPGSLGSGGRPGSGGEDGSGGVTGLGGGLGTAGVLDNACASNRYEAEERPLTLYTLFDDSGSMFSVWIPVTQAFIQFTQDPASAGINVGIKFFGRECSADFYATPDIAVDTLPGHAAAIENNLGTHLPLSGTATTPALAGALTAAQERAAQFPDEKVVILLVTDGEPSTCDSTLQNASDAAAAAAAAGIPVYVLGLGDVAGLNALAQAGGTGEALVADPNMTDLVVEAMNEIRGRALPCDYAMPPGGEAMLNLINLVYEDGAGGGGTIPKVADQSQCDGTRGGWFFGANNTRLIACPETCIALKSGAAQTVNVVLGCPTVILY